MKKALVLAGGIPQIKLIQELQKRGYYVILADYYPNPIAKKYADKFYQKSTLDVDAIRNIAVKEKVDLILTCCTDQALATVSKVSNELNLPCYIGEEVGLYVTNKFYMKKIFKQNQIPTADFKIVTEYGNLSEKNYPLIVKPVDCNSSKGVIKVYSDEELNLAVKNAIGYSRTKKAIIEKYISGQEISVDLFVKDGIAKILCISYSDKIQDNQKFVIYKGYSPIKISDVIYKKIEKVAQQIVQAFNLKNCPMLIQILCEEEDIYVVEFSARTGGCIKYHMIELASGVDIIKTTIDLFEGKKIDITPSILNKIIVNEFIYCEKGEFSHLQGFEECKKSGVLEDWFLLKNPGEKFEKVESSGDRIAAITYVSDSYEEYVEKHNHVASVCKVIDKNENDIMRHDLLQKIR